MSDPSAPSPRLSPPPAQPLKGREIIVGVCGSIACYKVADVVSKLVQRGAGVTVCMTDAATRFVAAMTFEALSGRKVHVDLFRKSSPAIRSTSA